MKIDTNAPAMFEGERANFYGPNGKRYLVRCPSCKRENYAPSVSSGQCAWCGWSAYNGSEE